MGRLALVLGLKDGGVSAIRQAWRNGLLYVARRRQQLASMAGGHGTCTEWLQTPPRTRPVRTEATGHRGVGGTILTLLTRHPWMGAPLALTVRFVPVTPRTKMLLYVRPCVHASTHATPWAQVRRVGDRFRTPATRRDRRGGHDHPGHPAGAAIVRLCACGVQRVRWGFSRDLVAGRSDGRVLGVRRLLYAVPTPAAATPGSR